jgi:hypothetical protein
LRQIEELLEQAPQPLALLHTCPQQLVPELRRELVAAGGERREDAVHRRRRRPQLV